LVYKINEYSGFKQADDYYEISLNGTTEYKPQTIEEICYYGADLMRNAKTFKKGLEYIEKANLMGHGKAKNILQNLRLYPDEKNVDLLMKQPSKTK
jgi:hypothetical protein